MSKKHIDIQLVPPRIAKRFPTDKHLFIKQWYTKNGKVFALRWWSPKRREEIVAVVKFTPEMFNTLESVPDTVKSGREYDNA